MFRCHCWDLIVTQFKHLTWDKWKLKCCFTGLRSVVLCSQQFFIGHDRCLLLLPAVERLLFLPACSYPLTEVITEEASDRSALVWGKNSSLALNFLIGLGYFGRLFLQWVNSCLNTLLDQYFGGSVRTEELRTSSFSTAGDRRLFLIVWFHSLTFFHSKGRFAPSELQMQSSSLNLRKEEDGWKHGCFKKWPAWYDLPLALSSSAVCMGGLGSWCAAITSTPLPSLLPLLKH